MYSNSSEWVLKVNVSRLAQRNDNGGVIPLLAIEPDTVFTRRTIAVYANSDQGSRQWIRAGELLQIFLTGFGEGYAQGEWRSLILNRYTIHKFDVIPTIGADLPYLMSFVPKRWLPDITLKIWEYTGTNQGVTPEDLDMGIKQNQSRIRAESSAIRQILRRIERNQ